MSESGRLHVRAAVHSRKDRGNHPTADSVDLKAGVGSEENTELSSEEKHFHILDLRGDPKLHTVDEPAVTGLQLADQQRRGPPSRQTSF
jgi:hypothetical protein